LSRLPDRKLPLIAIVCAVSLCASLLLTPFASAADEVVDNAADESNLTSLQKKLEDTANAYNDATARVDELDAQIADTESRIAQLEADLPEQQERCNDALRNLYLYQQETGSFLDMLLGAQSFEEFVNNLDYFNRLNEYNIDAIEQTAQMKDELEASKQSLVDARNQAEAVKSNAANALADAQAAREEAAAQAAAAQAAQQAAAQQAAQDAASATTDTSSSTATDPGSVDWSTDKTSFVATWAPRIDAYLAGSAMDGCGTDYAAAAWDYGVDPRWAPAISNVESSKGANCFRSYNAWGYGGFSFGSWQEGIYRVVRGLSLSPYNGVFSLDSARYYCPPTYEDWYDKVAGQMAQI